MKSLCCVVCLLLLAKGAAGGPFSAASNGLHHTDARLRGWVTGWQDFVRPDTNSGGFAHDDAAQASGVDEAVLGPPASFLDPTAHVLSLGNGGSIVLTFAAPIEDGPGPDFAVFENGFNTDPSFFVGTPREGDTNTYTFAELATVEVSSDGASWVLFPVTYLNSNLLFAVPVCRTNHFSSQDVTALHNLAGKHVLAYGTAFDLEEVQQDPRVLDGSVNLNDIRYIRLMDVVGDGSRVDANGRPIYDPYYLSDCDSTNIVPAPASSTDGFDLRGVAVLNFTSKQSMQIDQDAGGVPTNVSVTVFAATNLVYQWQASTDLVGGVWENLGAAVPGDNTWRRFDDRALAPPRKYYRMLRMPGP